MIGLGKLVFLLTFFAMLLQSAYFFAYEATELIAVPLMLLLGGIAGFALGRRTDDPDSEFQVNIFFWAYSLRIWMGIILYGWGLKDLFGDEDASGYLGGWGMAKNWYEQWMSTETWLGWLIILGSIPIGTVGLVLKEQIEGPGTKNLWIISLMLIGVGLLLALAEMVSKWYERSGRGTREIENFGILDAIVVGFAQVLALMPGASRSGSTIMGGLFAGQKREAAARFSFLLSIPAITAAGLLQLREAWRIIPAESALPLLVSTIVSGIVGYLSIWFLLAFLRKNSTAIFIIYRVILGIALLLLLWRGVLDPVVNV
ncbi:undecaprenyl-diphosphate phosphatase [Leptolyngbya sp. 7M]|uniref:undecaprenyl-diphosphate phosphatase n=1 Tax=Leptolyngbya sp. 7M TaxID=2812896 RepID=UPI001B8D5CE9|nr:undecaprenyl-diphosphate phosphatase [Leptolyngbya sp. 7M]QYO67561.1 hypothetical protein JVX88_12645 [Leptolyngbya sp. 7M]